MERIYLDHAATTPLCPEARDAMLPWLEADFGNPSSLHFEGRKARQAIDEARERISEVLGCEFGELVFTSSGTEAANLAILGTALAHQEGSRKRVLMCAAEHHCVIRAKALLESLGFQVELVEVDRFARIDLDDLAKKLGDDVLLVCLMHANNELGTIQPAQEASRLAHDQGSLSFCDAVQTFGSMRWTVDELGADLLAFSSHKVYGPKGVGALYAKAGTRLKPLLVGGGQERELRAGTENVAGIVGFAAAARAISGKDDNRPNARDAFFEELGRQSEAPWLRTVPPEVPCLAGHAHLRFPGLSAESMLIVLDRLGVSASSGAACSSGSLEPSHVLLAAGCSLEEAKEGLRFTFGRQTTVEQGREAARRTALAAEQVLRKNG